MKRVLAAVLTAAVMGGLLWSGLRRSATDGPGTPGVSAADPGEAATVGDPTAAPDPYEGAEARVRGLLDDASRGDLDAYLAAFSGPLRARLEREIAERGRAAFADELRTAARTRKGRAVFAADPDGPDAARVVVETVYPDRNERQTFRVERDPRGDGWLVAEVELVRTHQPAARYGSLATFGGPEGVPVPTDAGPSGDPAAAPPAP